MRKGKEKTGIDNIFDHWQSVGGRGMKRDIVKILLLYVLRQKVEQGENLCIWEQLAYAGKHTLTTAKIRAPIVYDRNSCAAVHQGERLPTRIASMRP